MITVEAYIEWKQPWIMELIWLMWDMDEDELSPEQKMLDRLMRQAPRPGRGGEIDDGTHSLRHLR